MAHKQLPFHSAAREKILRGASARADAVRVTLGPKSKSVLLQKKWGTPLVCNGGVSIAPENAVSVASVLLLTEAAMTEQPEEGKPAIPHPEMAM